MNKHRHDWYYTNTKTLTLDYLYENYAQFASESGIDTEVVEYESIYNQVYNLYGDTDTKDNTRDYVGQRLRYAIEQEYDKYVKSNALWESQIELFKGELEEINQFNIGDIKEDIENFDKYKSARQTTLKTKAKEIMEMIKTTQSMMTPFEDMIERIAERVFMVAIPERY